MTTFQRILSHNANYLALPRIGEILGPKTSSNFIPLPLPTNNTTKHYSKLQDLEHKLQKNIEEAQN